MYNDQMTSPKTRPAFTNTELNEQHRSSAHPAGYRFRHRLVTVVGLGRFYLRQ